MLQFIADCYISTSSETEKKPHDTLSKIRPMMTASNFPFPVDGRLCSRHLFFPAYLWNNYFPWQMSPCALRGLNSSQRAQVIPKLPCQHAFTIQRNCITSEDANLLCKSIGYCKLIPFATVLTVHLCYGLWSRNRNGTNFALQRALAHRWMMSSIISNYYCPQCHTGIKCGK